MVVAVGKRIRSFSHDLLRILSLTGGLSIDNRTAVARV